MPPDRRHIESCKSLTELGMLSHETLGSCEWSTRGADPQLSVCCRQKAEDTMNMPNGNGKPRPRVDNNARDSALTDLDLMSAMRTDACMLLTGKEDAVRSLAHRIHTLSGWRHGPFTIVDCARPGETVERELFGLLSDTESVTAPEPYPRLSQAGTVLLQNVGRLPPTIQTRIAERLVHFCGKRRPGSRRLMASSSEPLLPRVLDGTFDDRLYYRLNVIHFVVQSERNMDETRGVRDEAETAPVQTRDRQRLAENRAFAPQGPG